MIDCGSIPIVSTVSQLSARPEIIGLSVPPSNVIGVVL